jgi:hypothetical protein
MGLKERDGQVRFVHTPDAKGGTWKTVIAEHVDMPEVSRVMTDDSSAAYSALEENREKHHVVRHTAKEYAVGIVSTNSVESSFSLFKRGLVGSWHKLSKKHIARYLQEMEYKHNNRKNPAIFEGVLAGIAARPRLTFRALVDGQESQFSFGFLARFYLFLGKWFITKQVTDDFYEFTFLELWVVWHGNIHPIKM